MCRRTNVRGRYLWKEVKTNMNQYVTGAVIKELREKNRMTQLQLAEKLGVTDKSISKWETLRGLPDGYRHLVNTVMILVIAGLSLLFYRKVMGFPLEKLAT